jgi:hypothetical protein
MAEIEQEQLNAVEEIVYNTNPDAIFEKTYEDFKKDTGLVFKIRLTRPTIRDRAMINSQTTRLLDGAFSTLDPLYDTTLTQFTILTVGKDSEVIDTKTNEVLKDYWSIDAPISQVRDNILDIISEDINKWLSTFR